MIFEKIVQIESLIAAIITLIATISAYWLKGRMDRPKECPEKKEQRKMEELTEKNTEIINCLEHTLNELGADRCYIFEFSNGIHFSSGMPVQKFTCSYEFVGSGISSECQNPGEYRVSNYNSYIKNIIKGKEICIEKIDDCKIPLLKELLYKKGVKSLYNFPIKNLQGKVVGFFGVDYVKRPRSLEGQHLEILKNRALKLAGYLKDD